MCVCVVVMMSWHLLWKHKLDGCCEPVQTSVSVSLMCLPGPSAQFLLWCFSPLISLLTRFFVSSVWWCYTQNVQTIWMEEEMQELLFLFITAAAFGCRRIKTKKKKKTRLVDLISKCYFFLLWLLVYQCSLLDVCCCDRCQKKVFFFFLKKKGCLEGSVILCSDVSRGPWRQRWVLFLCLKREQSSVYSLKKTK